MSEKAVGKPWTTYEDSLLIQAVAIHGENDNWKAVAASVPGRTNKACRKRWLHSLSPNVKKTAWTPEEDQLLLSLYATHGTKWSVIARGIPGRTDDACSKRYREALDPTLKREDWTSDEDARLIEAHSRLGGKWGLIGQELNRSGLGCRNRWRMLERRRVAVSRDATARGEPSSSAPASSGTPSHWTPTHIQEPQLWDGQSPQYVTPSVLYQGSPPHTQESHGASFSPEQILSGAHLNGTSSGSREAPTFQYRSSPLSVPLSHAGSFGQSPDHQGHYHSTAYAPAPHSAGIGVVVPEYGSHDYQYISSNTNHLDIASPPAYEHDGGVETGPATETVFPVPSDAYGTSDFVYPGDTPASPSQRGSLSPPGSPASPFGGQHASGPNTGGAVDHVNAPRSQYYLTDAEKARRATTSRKANSQRPVRLSSALPATTDASVLAYACGHRDCWPADASESKNAFATSRDLSDHSKFHHNGDLGGSKPFRCGLTGCEKSWKSINGLQYHLQISRYHFQQALAARTENPDDGGSVVRASADAPGATPFGAHSVAQSNACNTLRVAEEQEAVERTGTSTHDEHELPEKTMTEKRKRKVHPCPHPGCGKEYKQLSGLRYHLTHGHVDMLPLQLDVVPPTLARIVAEKGSTARN